jgi:hypothetical protein
MSEKVVPLVVVIGQRPPFELDETLATPSQPSLLGQTMFQLFMDHHLGAAWEEAGVEETSIVGEETHSLATEIEIYFQIAVDRETPGAGTATSIGVVRQLVTATFVIVMIDEIMHEVAKENLELNMTLGRETEITLRVECLQAPRSAVLEVLSASHLQQLLIMDLLRGHRRWTSN